VPCELADGVLEETGTRERRRRVLPSRTGVCFQLALGLFLGQLRSSPGSAAIRMLSGAEGISGGITRIGLPERGFMRRRTPRHRPYTTGPTSRTLAATRIRHGALAGEPPKGAAADLVHDVSALDRGGLFR
jgi:Insertion element 4 transposase N-terminal